MNTSVNFGFINYDFDGLFFKNSDVRVPCAYFRITEPTPDNGRKWGLEAVFPLENTCTAWLFGEKHTYWEVGMTLWVPCPLHPNAGYTVNQCEMAAQWAGSAVVTHAKDCAGNFCVGCFHDTNSVTADPGDVDEFFDVLKHWSGLTYERFPEDVVPHQDHLAFIAEKGFDLNWKMNDGL